MATKKVKTKYRKYSWKDLCDKAEEAEEPVLAYDFPQTKLYENPRRPYGPRKWKKKLFSFLTTTHAQSLLQFLQSRC